MSFNDQYLYHGPVGLLPMVPEVRAGGWQNAGMLTAASDTERRRRRLDMYRQRHNANVRSYDLWTNAVADSQREQTAMLFQRWMDSRCKRTPVTKSKVSKGETLLADGNNKSMTIKGKRRNSDAASASQVDQLTAGTAECFDNKGTPRPASKQRKLAESGSRLPSNTAGLEATPGDAMPALMSVPESVNAGTCKQEGLGSEFVGSNMDFDDDPSVFIDILRTINGGEFPSEFQKLLSESEKDDSGLNYSSVDLTTAVTDAVSEKLLMFHQCASDNLSPAHPAALSTVPAHREMKHVEVVPCVPAVQVDYCLEPWQQQHDSVMHYLRQVPTSMPSYNLNAPNRLVQVKQLPHHRRQFQPNDDRSEPRIQYIHHHQQQQQQLTKGPPQQSWYPVSAGQKLKQSQEHIQPNFAARFHEDWHVSPPSIPHHQIFSHQFIPSSLGADNHSVKKEIPLDLMGADDAAKPRAQHLLTPLPNLVRGDHQLRAVNASQCIRAPSPFVMNQRSGYTGLSKVIFPEFGSSLNLASHGTGVPVFSRSRDAVPVLGPSSVRKPVSDVPVLVCDQYIPHMMTERVSIPPKPESTN